MIVYRCFLSIHSLPLILRHLLCLLCSLRISIDFAARTVVRRVHIILLLSSPCFDGQCCCAFCAKKVKKHSDVSRSFTTSPISVVISVVDRFDLLFSLLYAFSRAFHHGIAVMSNHLHRHRMFLWSGEASMSCCPFVRQNYNPGCEKGWYCVNAQGTVSLRYSNTLSPLFGCHCSTSLFLFHLLHSPH